MEGYNHLDGASRVSAFFYTPMFSSSSSPYARSNHSNSNNNNPRSSNYHTSNSNDTQQTSMLMSCFNLQNCDHHQKSEEDASSSKLFHYPLATSMVVDHQEEQIKSNESPINNGSPACEIEALKAKIMAHPQYSSLLAAYMDCQKMGAPPEVEARLTAAKMEFESRQRSILTSRPDSSAKDPELDQFMAYCDMLVKYREEITRPIQEAMEFMRRVEAQLAALSDVPPTLSNFDEKGEGWGSSDGEQSGGEIEMGEVDPRAEDRELKNRLLRKYSGYLSSLKQELSKKKKKGKLPREARQKLLSWWELHYKWPYPSETEKLALAESTGLDQKQINNWFINQRKRHWRPSEDMQLMVNDGFYPHHANLLLPDARFLADASFRLGS